MRQNPTDEPLAADAIGETLNWDRRHFCAADAPERVCPERIDITGRARALITGPLVRLKAGHWRATVTIHLCEEAARRSLAVQFAGESDLAAVNVPRGVPGVHVLRVDHQLAQDGDAQLRILLRKPAFHGDLTLVGALLERLHDAPGEPC